MPIPSEVERISDLLHKVESRLGDSLTPQWAARNAYWSLSHFHRKFRAVTGESYLAYIRGRRLHQAAQELLTSRTSIECIASRAYFAHVPAFYKAFQNQYAKTPLAYRSEGRDLWYLGRDSIQPDFLSHLHGGRIDGDPRLIQEPARQCAGISASGGWSDFEWLFLRFREDLQRAGARPDRIHLFLHASQEDLVARRLTVHIGVEPGRLEKLPFHWEDFTIPGGTVAEFLHRGGSHAHTCFHIWRHWKGRESFLSDRGYSMQMDYDGSNPFSGKRPLIFRVPICP